MHENSAAAATSAELLDRLDRLEPGRPHQRLMLRAGLGYTFDSFDGALMGSALAALIVIWHIPSGTGGWLLSALFIGYLVGALAAGVLADRFGRRRLMMTALVIFCLFSALMATATSTTELFVWRALSGIGIGAETTLIAPYVSEFLPARYRGRFVARTVGFLSFGYILAGVTAPLVIAPDPETGWRIAALIAAAPVLLLLWWRRSLPESPRYLISQGRLEEAARVVERFEEASATAAEAPVTTNASTTSTPSPARRSTGLLAGLFAGGAARTTVVLWVLWFILTGVNYGFHSWLPAMLVAAKGFSITKSLLYGLVTAVAQVPGYYVAGLLIDRIERKWLLACYATGATLSALGVALADDPTVLLVSAAFLAAFTNGSAAIYYTYTAELYPTAVRTTGMGAASAVGRLGAIAAPVAIGYLYGSAGFTNVFLVLVGALAIAVSITIIFGQKTAGVSLEELEGTRA